MSLSAAAVLLMYLKIFSRSFNKLAELQLFIYIYDLI